LGFHWIKQEGGKYKKGDYRQYFIHKALKSGVRIYKMTFNIFSTLPSVFINICSTLGFFGKPREKEGVLV